MDGILVVDKPQGWTSHDVVDFIRTRFGFKKVGHAGTLDPMATGVLVVLIGSLTKSSSLFSADDKEYEATLTLGAESDTGDADGKISDSGKPANYSRREIEDVFKEFLGEIEQRPPMYSAIKIKGERLYKLARRGIDVAVGSRKICIKNIEITDIKLPEVSFRVTCSKGTYVRSLAVDIGKALGCGAYLSRLKRTRSGRFGIDGAIKIDKIKTMVNPDLERSLIQCGL
ncbi:MAG: tRNA pseudouridine(55) synthase TruB [Candidatus Omnitrophica bacterium]|nr:tRNA pseudouridine(55) synthase TruB [Candidatus Omnitrophota bacterium]